MIPEKELKAGDQLTLRLLLHVSWEVFVYTVSTNELLSPSSWAWSAPGMILGSRALLYQGPGCLPCTAQGCGMCPVSPRRWPGSRQRKAGAHTHTFCVSSG